MKTKILILFITLLSCNSPVSKNTTYFEVNFDDVRKVFLETGTKGNLYLEKSNEALLQNNIKLAETYLDSCKMCLYTTEILYEIMYSKKFR